MAVKKNKAVSQSVSRRSFIQGAATATASTLVSRPLSGREHDTPSNKLNIACIGIGGMGKSNLKRCETENIVALCDVDQEYAAPVFKKYPRAKTYVDYRVLLEKQKDIDAVIIATPDHTHAVIALAAMQLGKHVYVQKPLTHSVYEARKLTEAARQYGVATQMGNQGHSGEGARLVCEWIWSGALGNIHEVHAWTNRPVWPQGVEVGRPPETPPVPQGLNWDLWLGPAQYRPYHPAYPRQSWRAWWDFGTGSLGDLACHILDPAFWALSLKYPESVEGNISTYWGGFWKYTEPKNEQFPRSTIVRYQFPARDSMPPVHLTWWDGGLMPPRPKELAEGQRMGDDDGGLLFIGERGKLMTGCYGTNPRLLTEEGMDEFPTPEATIDRIPDGSGGHEQDWLRACKGGPPASAQFDYSGPLTEMVLMGNLAVRYPNRRLAWDGPNMKLTNDPEANAFVHPPYRDGWSL